MIINRRGDDVQLGAEVGAGHVVRWVQKLVALLEAPPQLVQILIGIVVHGLLEAQHDLRPAAKDQFFGPQASSAGGGELGQLAFRQADDLGDEFLVLGDGPEEHGDAFGGQNV